MLTCHVLAWRDCDKWSTGWEWVLRCVRLEVVALLEKSYKSASQKRVIHTKLNNRDGDHNGSIARSLRRRLSLVCKTYHHAKFKYRDGDQKRNMSRSLRRRFWRYWPRLKAEIAVTVIEFCMPLETRDVHRDRKTDTGRHGCRIPSTAAVLLRDDV